MTSFTLDHVQTLGAAVRRARKALGLTQSQLALSSAVGLRFIVELEAGKPTVRLDAVLRVVQSLGGSLAVVNFPETTANVISGRA
jgi:HTH-type transcriptional regulator / antitoxin HipB